MEKEQLSKRLYVGGLGHTISKAELQERFGKFGHVLDAEIITRRDDQGNPMKTFAYISVNISDADLKKCVSILNKTKWKGGTLQIEMAKESFLHRLAVEREEAKLQKEKPQRNDKISLLESMKKAGVADFHMKAVPGTEVPDHKKWVVGKFGRVLPILHLRNQQKNKIVKYDPSKYCHNLRKLEPDLTHLVPVSELTWHLEGGDDTISKKRRGEFPVAKKPLKKVKQLGSEAVNGAGDLSSGCQSHSKSTSSQLDQRSRPNGKSKLPLSRSFNSQISGRGLLSNRSSVSGVAAQNNTSVSDSDIDSEEEIRAMVKKESEKQKAENIEAEDVETESDHLEIVGDNFELKYNTHWSLSKPGAIKKAIRGGDREAVECDNGYDSAGTDEIIAESKTSDRSSRKAAVLESKLVAVENKETLTNKKCDLVKDSSVKNCNLKECCEGNGKMKKSKTGALQSTAVNSTTKASSSESSSSEPEEGESDISSNYESMMQNCYHLDLTLDDLKALATGNSGIAEDSDSAEKCSQHHSEENPISNVVNNPKILEVCPAVKKKSISPEDVLAEILAGEESVGEESSKGQDNSGLKYRPFRGMGSLFEKEVSQGSTGVKKRSVDSSGIYTSISCGGEESSEKQAKNHPLNSLQVSSKKKRQNLHCEQHKASSDAACVVEKRDQPASRPCLQGKNKDASSSQGYQSSKPGDAASNSDKSEVESTGTDNDAAVAQKHLERQLKSPKQLSTKLKQNVCNKSPECNAPECKDGKTSLLENRELCLHATASKEPSTQTRQLQDNLKRLAALEERQKERELQKKLIQGALSKVDSQPASKHKHIVFNSDAESEAEADEMSKMDVNLGKRHGDGKAKTSCKLFESSEDEQEDTDDEIFKIKPHFEGKAGEKLLQLQSRFGTDKRFRMDARFLESDSEEEEANTSKADEEEELAAEKKKNLQILGSLLNIDLKHSKTNKKAASAKKFRDINALRYDPTREDHAVFEKKPTVTEKESKAKRKKKKEESEKRPEVSKETYYNITVDLKELLGSSKSKSTTNEEIPWDKEDLDPDAGSKVAQESSGFMFSFFGDTEESSKKEEPYVIETIKPVKVTWQEDPRFHDSSSEGDDEQEAAEIENDGETFLSLPHTETKRFFFFSKADERLREGPRLFCRSVDLSEDRDGWEERRRLLLEECRKKHKDARRKVRPNQ